MAEPADMDEIVRRIRAELRAGGTLPPAASEGDRPADGDEALREIRGGGGGPRARGRFLAGLLGPILLALAVAGLLALLG